MTEKPLTMAEVYTDAFAAGRAAERAEIVATLCNLAELRRLQMRQAKAGGDDLEALLRSTMANECAAIAVGIERRAGVRND